MRFVERSSESYLTHSKEFVHGSSRRTTDMIQRAGDNQSMDEDALLALCRPHFGIKLRYLLAPYDSAEVYGFGKYIRQYGYFPSCLPLCVYTDHGAGRISQPYEHELKSDAPCQLYHSPQSAAEWSLLSDKCCHIIFSPFVYYRHKYNISKRSDAAGTIAYPAHTTKDIDDVSDMELYIKQLIELPAPFQPVSACLHMAEIKKGRHKLFAKYKVPVYTAGHSMDYRFTERFYDILRRFAYSTSNVVGSYTYYSVEMGIPFSIYGNKQIYINRSDPNVTIGEYDPYKESITYRMMYDLFSGLHTEISKEQREIVMIDLGMNDGINRTKMAYVLYASFLKWITSPPALYNYVRSRISKIRQR